MSSVADRAEQVRQESLDHVFATPGLREGTRSNVIKADEACRRLVERPDELSVVGVVRMIEELHPGSRLAEQTFYNKTPSGACYREVIAIWRTYSQTISQLRKTRVPASVQDDLPDILLNQLQPEGARTVVLAMRTSLRNMRRQLLMLRSLTPDRLVRHREPALTAASSAPAIVLTREESDILAALIDPTEASSRGAEWDDLGRLIVNEEALSRAGLLQVVKKILDAGQPPKPADSVKAQSRKTGKR